MKIHKQVLPEVHHLIYDTILPNKYRYVNIRNSLLAIKTYPSREIFSLNNEVPEFNEPLNSFSPPTGPAGSFQYYTPYFQNGVQTSNTQGIPWYAIALIHYLECGLNFNRQLFNGDPLTNYTTHVPKGQPQVGHKPPFSFEESAAAALKYQNFDKIDHWTLPVILRNLEAYNGFGYEKYHNMYSPYLWSGSNHYSKGKYVADGKFDPNAVSKQIGAAIILRDMDLKNIVTINYA